MRERLDKALKEAMIAKDRARVSTIRLILAAIKDRDIASRSDENSDGVTEADILGILGKMVKQREDSAAAFEEGGRLELAERERQEITIVREFLPRQMTDDEMKVAVGKVVADLNAGSIRDMGKVMGALKAAYAGQMDFSKAGAAVKAALG